VDTATAALVEGQAAEVPQAGAAAFCRPNHERTLPMTCRIVTKATKLRLMMMTIVCNAKNEECHTRTRPGMAVALLCAVLAQQGHALVVGLLQQASRLTGEILRPGESSV